jgi:Zn finger protein HypA/HybF involved in hydrogenase expression
MFLNSKEIINYYYDFILQSALNSFVLKKEYGNIDEKELKDINYFLLDKESGYKKPLSCLIKHISELSLKEKKNYKILFFPFVDEFIEISKNREDKVYSSPIFFTFNIEDNFKKILIELKNISKFYKPKFIKSIFESGQLNFNNYYVSNKLYIILNQDLEQLKTELKDKEFEKKHPSKDMDYYLDVLKNYFSNSRFEINGEDFEEVVIKYKQSLKKHLDKNSYLNTLIDSKIKSLIAVINIDNLLEQDKMVKGLLDCYKSTILPYFNNEFENFYTNDKINRFLYSHPSEYLEAYRKQINIDENEKNTVNLTKEKIKFFQKLHYGSFNKEFAVTRSQRLAMCAYLSPMDLIPVNGPPGTGKTALLRAIFSDYMVKTALNAYKSYKNLEKDPYVLINTGKPILGTSSVRQAINNIIEGISGGFAESSKDENILFHRWLKLPVYEIADGSIDLIDKNCVVPQIRNSGNKYENDILFTGLNNIFNFISGLNYSKMEQFFINNINKISENKLDSLNECVEFLYKKINGLIGVLENKIDSTDDDNFKMYEELDVNERYQIFFFSLHLLEALFIINIKRLNKKTTNCKCPLCGGEIGESEYDFHCNKCHFKIYKNDKYNQISIQTKNDLNDLLNNQLKQNEKNYGLKYYEGGYHIVELEHTISNLSNDIKNIYLITPLFPMITVTMHSLFGSFKHRVGKNSYLIKDFFDLVLSDESGMILAPVALPAIYIGKKIVIVGDEKQIEPVYPFDEIVDKSIINNIKSGIDYDRFKKESAIYTNFLQKVNGATYFDSFMMKEEENHSLWLQEHFRCKDEIIEYCNEIIYNGILIPKVRTFKKNLYLDNSKYKSMKLFDVESVVKNNSSMEEAKKILDFLLKNIKELTNLYNLHNKKNLSPNEFYRHIGIVTPFNNQKKLIKRLLKNANKYNLDKILVGTVHAFQGSEREVILFSPAVDKNYNGIHFTNNDNGNMINVAVSRAKSAFWVFGSKTGLKNAGEYTKKLVDYIDENFECKLKCPICGSCIIENESQFRCENAKWNPRTKILEECNFVIWKKNKITNSNFIKDNLINLLKNKEIEINNEIYKLNLKNKFFIEKVNKNNDLNDKCPKCRGKLVIKKGKYGKFYGCSNYPKCKYTRKIEK